MNRSSLRRTGAAGAALIALTLGLAACGDDADSGGSASDDTSSSAAAPADDTTTEPAMADDAGADTFGPGCSAIPKDGKGSFNGMVTDPVATAASNNPLLTTLVAAVTAVPGLADTLNAAPALTVFAPTNDGFAQDPRGGPQGRAGRPGHADRDPVAPRRGRAARPRPLAGEHETLNGDTVTVEGDAEAGFTVDGGAANVICGNIPTKNATVYVIDSVLMPTK